MGVSWSNITELIIATAFGGALVWLFTNSAAPFFKRHKIRLFRLPVSPRDENQKRWQGYYIRNISKAKAINIEILIDEKLHDLRFEPNLLYEKVDADQKSTAIRVQSLPAKSEYILWVKPATYSPITGVTADGISVSNDSAESVLKDWREWHSHLIWGAVIFISWMTIVTVLGNITDSTATTTHPTKLLEDSSQKNNPTNNP